MRSSCGLEEVMTVKVTKANIFGIRYGGGVSIWVVEFGKKGRYWLSYVPSRTHKTLFDVLGLGSMDIIAPNDTGLRTMLYWR
jgi:hypothetical protein